MADEQMKDVYDGMEGYVKATHWAKPYFSNHHHENPPTNPKMLHHVNCGYLSTPGRPPTLEALKQHAQSLTYLISTLAPNSIAAEVDNENQPKTGLTMGDHNTFARHEAYDWLNNLRVPYDNIDTAHRKPLNSLVNLIKRNNDESGVIFHCPLDECPIELIEENGGQVVRPFQTHMTLLMHANECLERLDHEYSAMGGLLAIIPTEHEKVAVHPDIDNVKETLIGQWLLHTQHLTARMHELEIAYANALDLLANEAVIPAQHLSAQGPDARSGRELVFPQDRWVLANAGEDVFTFIHQMLDKKEGWSNTQDRTWMKQNVVGDVLRRDELLAQPDQELLRGITHVDLQTRFYRLKGGGSHAPLFVLPAFSDRPNTEYTKELEKRPTVVTIPAPTISTYTSAWDKRHQGIERANNEMTVKISDLTQENVRLKQANEAQADEMKRLRHITTIYEQNQGADGQNIATRMATSEKERDEARAGWERTTEARNKLQAELELYKETTRREQVQVPAGVTQTESGYAMSEAQLKRFQNRSETLLAAKSGIERIRSVIVALGDRGQLDLRDFAFLDNVARCP